MTLGLGICTVSDIRTSLDFKQLCSIQFGPNCPKSDLRISQTVLDIKCSSLALQGCVTQFTSIFWTIFLSTHIHIGKFASAFRTSLVSKHPNFGHPLYQKNKRPKCGITQNSNSWVSEFWTISANLDYFCYFII